MLITFMWIEMEYFPECQQLSFSLPLFCFYYMMEIDIIDETSVVWAEMDLGNTKSFTLLTLTHIMA